MKLIAKITAFLGALVATTATTGCITVILDEPEMPKTLL